MIAFIVSDLPSMHTFPMSHGPEDDLLPWVVGGVLLLAMTIAVSAVAGSGGTRVVPPAVQPQATGQDTQLMQDR